MLRALAAPAAAAGVCLLHSSFCSRPFLNMRSISKYALSGDFVVHEHLLVFHRSDVRALLTNSLSCNCCIIELNRAAFHFVSYVAGVFIVTPTIVAPTCARSFTQYARPYANALRLGRRLHVQRNTCSPALRPDLSSGLVHLSASMSVYAECDLIDAC